MKKITLALIGICLILGLAANTAHANSITYDYNYIISGPTSLPSPLGTLTLTDNGYKVDFNLVLANPSWKILELTLNFDDSKFGNSSNLKLSTGDSLLISENGINADGFPGMFDIQIPSNGNLGALGNYSGSILWNNGFYNLNVSDFNFTDTSGLLNTALHIGSVDSNGNSVWVGNGTQAVPEPGTLVLLGFGLLGIVGFRKMLEPAPVRA